MTQAQPDKVLVLEQALTRAAEEVGDLTTPAMNLFYERHPTALAAFERHGLGKRTTLETEMVDTALYCLMTWLERPTEIQIMLFGSVNHHRDTLHVRPEWYGGLIDAVLDIILGAIPKQEAAEFAVIDEIRSGLHAVLDDALAVLPAAVPILA